MTSRLATFAVLALAVPAAAPAADLPGWLTGCHREDNGDRWTDECWTAPRAGVMLGSGRSGRGDRLASWEFMRIERVPDGKLTFWGSPQGAPAVAFALDEAAGDRVVFLNRAHDYPQRISYRRSGGAIEAEISRADGSKPMRWRYRPAR